ncbi:LysR substrate-binding domain-containing protein [Uliginosibacterium sp. sgz301328]|uniref:LysR substrate-binding domain-containing protein n=1 Tax=Uliginosibacterium sp. sgz301328 TaxID=3243764 RepID=UPI00359EF465
METRSLLYFIAVAEERNIGRAATRLHITQPALTRQIKSLEDEVGVPLFTRTTAGMDITPAGTTLLRHARAIRAELAQAKTNVVHACDAQPFVLDVGVYGSAILNTVPKVLAAFLARHPRTEYCLHNVRKDQLVELLRRGTIQVAFDRYLPQEPDLAFELVSRERLCVAVHKDHRLATRESVDAADLAGEPRIGANFDSPMAARLAQVFGHTPVVQHRADDSLTVLALVGAGCGIGFAPASMASLHIENVVFLPYTEPQRIPFDLQCMYRRDDTSPAVQAMLETIREFRTAQAELLQ